MEDVQLSAYIMSNEKEFKDPAEKTWHHPQGIFFPKILNPLLE